MKIGKNKRNTLVTAALITHHYFNEILHREGGSFAAVDKIAEYTCEFEEEEGHRWSGVVVGGRECVREDYEEILVRWVSVRLNYSRTIAAIIS